MLVSLCMNTGTNSHQHNYYYKKGKTMCAKVSVFLISMSDTQFLVSKLCWVISPLATQTIGDQQSTVVLETLPWGTCRLERITNTYILFKLQDPSAEGFDIIFALRLLDSTIDSTRHHHTNGSVGIIQHVAQSSDLIS